jgi:hypothetical protein
VSIDAKCPTLVKPNTARTSSFQTKRDLPHLVAAAVGIGVTWGTGCRFERPYFPIADEGGGGRRPHQQPEQSNMQSTLSYELNDAELSNVNGAKNITFGIGGGVSITIQTGSKDGVPRIWVCGETQCVDTKWPR